MTARADEVVMVFVASANPVATLCRLVRELIHEAGLNEGLERPINRRKPESLAAAYEPAMKLLGRRIVAFLR